MATLNIPEENFTTLDGNAQGYATGMPIQAGTP
jgi:hypothetical protein